MNLTSTGTFEYFYELPLNEEAHSCEVGRELYLERRAVNTSGGLLFVRVLSVRDTAEGRHVQFQEIHADSQKRQSDDLGNST